MTPSLPVIAAWAGTILFSAYALIHRFKQWHDRPLTDNDVFLAAQDEALDRREQQRIREDAEVAWLEEVWALPAAEVHH